MNDTPKTQYDRFKETARALGCDEDEATFDEKLKVVVRHKPKSGKEADANAPEQTQRRAVCNRSV